METNDQPTNKNEIITLILADMRNRKLLMGLEATGLCTDIFNTNLSDLIFSKMKIAKQDAPAITDWYEDTVCGLLIMDLNKFREHQLFLAVTLYDALEGKRTELQTGFTFKPASKCSLLKWVGWKRIDH